jgi:hypothetical protein
MNFWTCAGVMSAMFIAPKKTMACWLKWSSRWFNWDDDKTEA